MKYQCTLKTRRLGLDPIGSRTADMSVKVDRYGNLTKKDILNPNAIIYKNALGFFGCAFYYSKAL